MKRAVFVLILVVLALTTVVPAFAAEDAQVGIIVYTEAATNEGIIILHEAEKNEGVIVPQGIIVHTEAAKSEGIIVNYGVIIIHGDGDGGESLITVRKTGGDGNPY